ncbi:MAG: YwaF family protein [Clostridia bacterium]|nr:YwaF family protein [Clostridia bacterium]
MEFLIKLIVALQYEIERPRSWGAFHLFWIALCALVTLLLLRHKPKNREKYLKSILGVFGFTALALEIAKQVIWSYDGIWHYQWYAAPFQLCTTPIFASLIALFLPRCRARDNLLSYMAFVTILGSVATAVYPESCFVPTLLVDVHTMFLHLGGLCVSLCLLAREVDFSRKSFRGGFCVFLIFAGVAEALNVAVYHSGVLNGETFNMFYISPYFISALPVFDAIQQSVPFPVFLLAYLAAMFLGSGAVFLAGAGIKKMAAGRSRRSLPGKPYFPVERAS